MQYTAPRLESIQIDRNGVRNYSSEKDGDDNDDKDNYYDNSDNDDNTNKHNDNNNYKK